MRAGMVVLAHLGGMSTAGGRSLRDSVGPRRLCRLLSGAGAHQFGRPSRAIREGTSRALTMKASIKTVAAQDGPVRGRAPSTADGTTVRAAYRPIGIVASAR